MAMSPSLPLTCGGVPFEESVHLHGCGVCPPLSIITEAHGPYASCGIVLL